MPPRARLLPLRRGAGTPVCAGRHQRHDAEFIFRPGGTLEQPRDPGLLRSGVLEVRRRHSQQAYDRGSKHDGGGEERGGHEQHAHGVPVRERAEPSHPASSCSTRRANAFSPTICGVVFMVVTVPWLGPTSRHWAPIPL
jgi:hypothetical protein